jgi:hypothetical protein
MPMVTPDATAGPFGMGVFRLIGGLGTDFLGNDQVNGSLG